MLNYKILNVEPIVKVLINRHSREGVNPEDVVFKEHWIPEYYPGMTGLDFCKMFNI